MNNSIQYNVPTHSCCGCGACVNICNKNAINYREDDYGFIVPEVDSEKCVNCGMCVKVCPALNSSKNNVQNAYAAISKDANLLLQSSSGGIFGVLASYILNKGGVVYGCQMDNNHIAQHIRVDNIEDLPQILRSKYVQSNLGFIFRQIKKDVNNGLLVLFAGTPCQVSAVKNYIGCKNNLIVVDIVCHGVPSQKFFSSYITYLKRNNFNFKSLAFRAKKQVYNGMNWYYSIKYADSKAPTFHNWPEEAYTYYYMNSYTNRESCYECKYTTENRVGDLTLCDYWKWGWYHDTFKTGSTISGVLVNTEKGELLLERVKSSIEIQKTELEWIVNNNSCLRTPAKRPMQREKLLDKWLSGGYESIQEMYKREYKYKILKSKIVMMMPQSLLNYIENTLNTLRRR